MTSPAKRTINTPQNEEKSLAAGRAAGYCWVQNPRGRGRCTRRPRHLDSHKDYYAGTEWP